MLSQGQLVSFSLVITSGPSSLGTQDDLNKIQDILGASGITVISSSVENGLFGFSGSYLLLGSSYIADFQVEADQNYAETNDFISVIQNAVYQVTGNSSSVNGTPVVTGISSAVAPAPPNPGVTATIVTNAADSISKVISTITSTTWTLVAILVGIVVLILILFAYKPEFSKNVAHAAGAFV